MDGSFRWAASHSVLTSISGCAYPFCSIAGRLAGVALAVMSRLLVIGLKHRANRITSRAPNVSRVPRRVLPDTRAVVDGPFDLEQHDFLRRRHGAEDEHLTHEAGYAPVAEVDRGNHLPPYQRLRRVVVRELCTRLALAHLRPEIDPQSNGWLPRFGKRCRPRHGAHAKIDGKELLGGRHEP